MLNASSSETRFWRFAWVRLKALLVNGLALVVIGVIVWSGGQWIDGLFPVVSDARIEAIRQADDGAILFRYSFTKSRDCQLLSTNWFYNDNGVIGSADITRSGETPSRPPGRNMSVWWRVGAGEKIPGSFLVVNTYNCRLPWNSESTLGPFLIDQKAIPPS
jgi:hypothetical protein